MQVQKDVLRQKLGIRLVDGVPFPGREKLSMMKKMMKEGIYSVLIQSWVLCLHIKRYISGWLTPYSIQSTDLLAHNSLLACRQVQ